MVSDAQELMARYRISGVPITENGKLVGILTNRDLRFETDFDPARSTNVMTKDNLVTAPVGTDAGDRPSRFWPSTASRSCRIVDENYMLRGLITIKDIQKSAKYPNSAKRRQRPPALRRGRGRDRTIPWIAWPRW